VNVIFNAILASLICIAITGCASTDMSRTPLVYIEQSQLSNARNINRLGELMRYYDSLHEKKTHQLAEEYDFAKNNLEVSSDAESRFKYILLISMPNTAYTDIKGALDLLKNWPQEALLSPNLISFRKLLIMLLTEQQTVRTRARNLSQQLKTSEEQVKTLQKRIDAIKNMERTPFRRINP
jgi:hypothetical protein